MSMGAISEHWGLEDAAVMAFQAGVDLILFGPWAGVEPGDRRRIFDALKEAVEEGTITLERLDQSVKRILTVKMHYGLIDDPLPRRANLSDLALPESLDLARRIARESVTLVRDHASVLPLSPQETIPLIWPAELESSLAPLTEDAPFSSRTCCPFAPLLLKLSSLIHCAILPWSWPAPATCGATPPGPADRYPGRRDRRGPCWPSPHLTTSWPRPRPALTCALTATPASPRKPLPKS